MDRSHRQYFTRHGNNCVFELAMFLVAGWGRNMIPFDQDTDFIFTHDLLVFYYIFIDILSSSTNKSSPVYVDVNMHI